MESPPLQSEGGGQAVVVLESGCEIHVALPFLPHCDVIGSAFAALHFSISGAAISIIVGKMHSLKGNAKTNSGIQSIRKTLRSVMPTFEHMHTAVLQLQFPGCGHLNAGEICTCYFADH